MLRYFAHSLPDRPKDEWHELAEHLTKTAERAERFARAFGPGWGRLAGLWHDAGKYLTRFQRRIDVSADAHVNESVDHACVGALLAREKGLWRPLSLVIAGHHSGLKNLADVDGRLDEKLDSLAEARRDGLTQELEQQEIPALPPLPNDKVTVALWTRFLFSALVDADFLDTEAFYKGERVIHGYDLAQLLQKLESKLAEFQPDSAMNVLRRRVMEDCRAVSAQPRGFFTLTVPTGGGKTLASLLFALLHALRHDLERVIVVIPYTSIIDQTVKVYRDIFGKDAVLEHHSNVDPDKETHLNRIASENWDAPIVVTTSVQFFESLYANRTSRCRKLHRIARSVVVLDEVQTFPVNLLEPVKQSLRNVVNHFGVTAVLCTATQPALGFEAREITTDHRALFQSVASRFRIRMPETDEPASFEDLASEISGEHQVLAIVHRRDDAATLAGLVPDSIHLSARMCAAHRLATLAMIRAKLRAGDQCRVVATQLVEAGVDVDFPIVYRAFAGADSMAQAAGRCNREGRLTQGELRIFIPPTAPPRGILQTAQQRSFTMKQQGRLDLLTPETFSEYFRLLYSSASTDNGVLAAEKDFRFQDSAELFRIIDDIGVPIVCPYGDSRARLSELRVPGNLREKLRRIQPYIVTVYPQERQALQRAGALSTIAENLRLYELMPPFHNLYSEKFGLCWSGPPTADPAALIA